MHNLFEDQYVSIKKYRSHMAAGMLCIAFSTSLVGCAEILIGSAVMSAVAAADRRTVGAQAEDKEILLKANHAVSQLVGSAGQVEITSYNRNVLITGVVVNEKFKVQVEKQVNNIRGVQSVVNDLIIGDYSQGLASKSQDALITAKVKAALVNQKDLQANVVKVVTVKGHVYLLGIVTTKEAEAAAEAARSVGGVEKVIKMFEFITEDQIPKSPK